MISGILTATILVGCVGLFIGIFLGIAGIKFKVETDEREERNGLSRLRAGRF